MAQTESTPLIPEQEIDLREYVSLFWSQRWIIAASIVVFTAAFLGYSLRLKPVFTSTSKYITKTNGSGGGAGAELAGLAKLGGFSLPGKEDVDPLAHIDEIARNVDFLEKFLERKWAYNGDSLTLMQIWKSEPDKSKPDWEYRYKMRNIERLRNSVIVFSDLGGLRLLNTNAESADLAYQLNVFMLGLINDYMKNNVKSQAKENRLFVEKRIEEIRNELTASEDGLSIFHRSNLNLTSPQVSLQYRRLQRNVSVNEEIYLQLRKEYELARIQEKKDQPLVIVVKDPEIPLNRSKPNRKVIVLGGIIFGLMAGFILAAGRLLLQRK